MSGPRRVLVADDSPTARDIYRAYLQHAGFEVIEATNGMEALERVDAHRPDVVVLDLVLPRLDGLEVLRRIREDPDVESIPVVCVTAAMNDRYRARAMELECAAFVEKPDLGRRIVDVVRDVLESRVQAGGDETDP